MAVVDAQLRVHGVEAGGQMNRASVVINAAGPWVDKVAGLADKHIPLRLQKGTHLVYKEKLTPFGLLLEAAEILPHEQVAVVDIEDESPHLSRVDEGALAEGRHGGAHVSVRVAVGPEAKGRARAEGFLEFVLELVFIEGLESTTRMVDDHDRASCQ